MQNDGIGFADKFEIMPAGHIQHFEFCI